MISRENLEDLCVFGSGIYLVFS